MAKKALPPPSTETRALLRKEFGNKHLVAFSRGKDALGTVIAMREEGFELGLYHLEGVPGLRIVSESLAYYERVFDTKILRLPHPGLYRQLHHMVYRPPHQFRIVEQSAAFQGEWEYEDVGAAARQHYGFPESAFVCTGIRAKDNLQRRTAIIVHGPIVTSRRTCHAIWDWGSVELEAALRKHSVALPDDYRLFGRTFDGISARYTMKLRDMGYRDDYDRIMELFPLAEADVYRYEKGWMG